MKQLSTYEILDPARAEAIVQRGVVAMHGALFVGMVVLVDIGKHSGYGIVKPSFGYDFVKEVALYHTLMDLFADYSEKGIDFFKI